MSLTPYQKRIRNRSSVPKRVRAKRKHRIKAAFQLTRSQVGAIGAGHISPPPNYDQLMYYAFTVQE